MLLMIAAERMEQCRRRLCVVVTARKKKSAGVFLCVPAEDFPKLTLVSVIQKDILMKDLLYVWK